jgi:hypothetical protein
MLAGGFKLAIARLVRNGLTTATPQRVRAGGEAIEVTRVRITDAGRRAVSN